MAWNVETIVSLSAYVGGGLAMGLGAIGAAIGEGNTAARANIAVSRNPKLSGDIFKNMLVGQAVAESASIFALVIAILLLFLDVQAASLLKAAALMGAGLSMGLGAIGSGVGSGNPAGEACYGIARQPAVASQLTTNMLSPAPSRAAQVGYSGALPKSMNISINATTMEKMAGASCEGIARNPRSVANVTTTMLVGQAVAQTPSIFGLLISFILMFKSFPESTALSAAMALLGAGLCMGFGGIGPGIGNGMAAEGAVRWVARNVEHAGELMRIMLVGQAVSQSTAIYAMVVALVLIFVV